METGEENIALTLPPWYDNLVSQLHWAASMPSPSASGQSENTALQKCDQIVRALCRLLVASRTSEQSSRSKFEREIRRNSSLHLHLSTLKHFMAQLEHDRQSFISAGKHTPHLITRDFPLCGRDSSKFVTSLPLLHGGCLSLGQIKLQARL